MLKAATDPADPADLSGLCGLLLPLAAAEPLHAILGRRVRAEQVRELDLLTAERIDDEGLGMGRVDLHRHLLGGVLDLLEGTSQRLTVADELGAAAVGFVLPA